MTVAILPMKPPGSGKTRLADAHDEAFRKALAAAMFADVLTALTRSKLVEQVVVVTSDFDCARTAALHDATYLDDPGLDGHSAAASYGVQHAVQGGATRVLLVPGDCPALDPAELDELLAGDYPKHSCVVVPDRHGTGTNALLLTPPDSITPSFGPGSRERHLLTATEAGAHAEAVEVRSLALDVDTPEDLDALLAHLIAIRGNAAHTRGFLTQAGRIPRFD